MSEGHHVRAGRVWGAAQRQAAQGPTRPDVVVARLAAEQDAVVATWQLAPLGIGSQWITVRVRRGQLHRIFRGVYAVVAPDCLTDDGLFTAAALACGPAAILACHAAAAYHEMLRWRGDRDPAVITARDGGRKLRGIEVHRTRGLDPRDVWRRGALRVTSPERTALDLAAIMAPTALRRMLRQAQAERRVHVRLLLDVIERSRGHHGIRPLRAVVADGYVPTRSELEDVFVDMLDRAGIERPRINEARIVLGERIEPDMRWPELGLVVELDGAAWHEHRLKREEDARKQALMEAAGDRVLRVTWSQAVSAPRQTLARVVNARAAAAAAMRVGPFAA